MLAQLPDNDEDDEDDDDEEEQDSFTLSKRGARAFKDLDIWVLFGQNLRTEDRKDEKPREASFVFTDLLPLEHFMKVSGFFSHEQSPLWYIELWCHENLNIIKVFVALLYFVF